ncbi:MAG: hypothetical protein R3Y64_00205 [Peptostreptococcaceae bacterium]
MKSKSRKLIEYYGIDTCSSNEIKYFNQFNVDSIFFMNYRELNIYEITKFWASVDVIDYEIYKTPKGQSLEGQILTGNKVLVSCDLDLKFEYLDVNDKRINTSYRKVPFFVDVCLPNNFSNSSKLKISVLIEDILAQKIDEEILYNNTSMIAIIDIC